jgi:hypothetical protein
VSFFLIALIIFIGAEGILPTFHVVSNTKKFYPPVKLV